MAELSDAELRVAALAEANKFCAMRAQRGRVIPGTRQVLSAAETFFKFLKGEDVEGEDGAGD